MWAYLLSLILVGLPAAAGAFVAVRGAESRSFTNGATLIAYAIALTFVFVYFIPEGVLFRAPYWSIMPIALAGGLFVGGVVGLIRRLRRRDG